MDTTHLGLPLVKSLSFSCVSILKYANGPSILEAE
jgi:hypothetical protein